MVRNAGRITRFVVMAMLQAARARTLGLSEGAARSWGLNRAVFYAAAKRGFRGGLSGEHGPSASTPPPATYRLGDEEALRDPASAELVFRIGGENQTEERFDHQVASRFGSKENFRTAWDEAIQVVGRHDRPTLESRRAFYDTVYRPARDSLSDDWTQRFSPHPGPPSRPSPRADRIR